MDQRYSDSDKENTTHRSSDVFLEVRASCTANMDFSVKHCYDDQSLRKVFGMGFEELGILRPSQGPQYIRSTVPHV